jgi:predicted SprT family Zn-dependent metalloprotease
MNLAVAERLAKDLIEKHLHTQDSTYRWEFKWAKGKRVFGTCRYGRRKEIRLSKYLTELNDEARVTNTILHEIAHALDFLERGYSNHDYNWIRIAKSIGCDGKRCYSGDEVVKPKSKYVLVCPTESCDTEIPRHRKPKRDDTACAKCCKAYNNGRYSADYKLILKEN